MTVKEHEVKVFKWHYNLVKSSAIVYLKDFINQNVSDIDFYIADNNKSDKIIININGVEYHLLLNSYFIYDPYYNDFIVLESLSGFLFEDDKRKKDYVIKFLDNYIGKNLHDIKTIFSCAKHFSSKEEAEKVVDFLANNFKSDRRCFEIIDLNEE